MGAGRQIPIGGPLAALSVVLVGTGATGCTPVAPVLRAAFGELGRS